MSSRFAMLPVCMSFFATLAHANANASLVKPPKVPQASNEYVDESKLIALKQPSILASELDALGRGTIEERVARLKKKVLADLIVVEGGSFMMGDFGLLWSPEKLPYSDDVTSRFVHEVTLSRFSIAKYKTTYAEFDVYTDATRTQKAAPSGTFDAHSRHPTVPAGVAWQRAKDYCLWLGTITQVDFDLPTEAQWEYAARSRGQFFVWATDNGNLDYGRNVPAADQAALFSPNKDNRSPYPVGLFPPNPLGLYDASHNGEEWVDDWFDENYYKTSPKNDPRGPAQGQFKVARGWPNADSLQPNTMYRRKHPLVEKPHMSVAGPKKLLPPIYQNFGFRCAVQKAKL
jgi:sulfatase modifying factor 1